VGGEDDESFGEQGVAGEQCRGLVELFVRGRPAAAEVVVVHARQVVVDERVGVQALDRDRGRQGGIVGDPSISAAASARTGRRRLPPPRRL